MRRICMTAFADESSKNFDVQMEVLKDCSIGYIEIRGVNEKNIVNYTLEEVKAIKEQLDNSGIKVSAIGSPIAKMDLDAPFEDQVTLLKHTLDIAEILKCSYIRVFSFYLPKDEDEGKYRNEVFRKLRILAETAAERDVILLHENEFGLFGSTVDKCLDMMKGVNHPNLRLVLDAANFVVSGDKNYPDAVEKLWPYIEYIHIKDAVYGAVKGAYVPAGEGDGQIKELLDYLVRGGYNGFLSLEPHLDPPENRKRFARDSDFMPPSDEEGKRLFKLAYDALMKILSELNIKAI